MCCWYNRSILIFITVIHLSCLLQRTSSTDECETFWYYEASEQLCMKQLPDSRISFESPLNDQCHLRYDSNAMMAVAKNEALNEFINDVKSYDLAPTTECTWIPLIRPKTSWYWKHDGSRPTWTNWASGQPTLKGGDCACMKHLEWYNVLCNSSLGTVCQKPANKKKTCPTVPRDVVDLSFACAIIIWSGVIFLYYRHKKKTLESNRTG